VVAIKVVRFSGKEVIKGARARCDDSSAVLIVAILTNYDIKGLKRFPDDFGTKELDDTTPAECRNSNSRMLA